MIEAEENGMGAAILGGTFSILHVGHEALLRAAAQVVRAPSAARSSARRAGVPSLLIGLTSDEWMSARKLCPPVPYARREKNLRRLLSRLGLLSRSCIFELNDEFGPAIFDCGADTLAVSCETEKTAEKINQKRRASGLSPLRVVVVPLVLAQDGFPVSSSRITAGLTNAKGRRLLPLRVAVGSSNPSKLKGVQAALRRAFPGVRLVVRGLPVSSGVHEQPVGFEKTWQGASNRARAASRRWPSADYSIGLESGLIPMGGRHYDIQFCAMFSPSDGRMTSGCSMGFPLPPKVEKMVLGAKRRGPGLPASFLHPMCSLGDAIDSLSGEKNIGRKKGALHFLSRGLMERKEMTEQAVLCAFVERRSPV